MTMKIRFNQSAWSLLFLLAFADLAAQMRNKDWEPDFVWASIDPIARDEKLFAALLASPPAYFRSQILRRDANIAWQHYVQDIQIRIKVGISDKGWKVSQVTSRTAPVDGGPFGFVLELEKEVRKMRLFVSLVPTGNDTVSLTYVQTEP